MLLWRGVIVCCVCSFLFVVVIDGCYSLIVSSVFCYVYCFVGVDCWCCLLSLSCFCCVFVLLNVFVVCCVCRRCSLCDMVVCRCLLLLVYYCLLCCVVVVS